MKKKSVFRYVRFLAVMLVIACIGLVGVGIMRATDKSQQQVNAKKELRERTRRGVGSEVRFASVNDTPENVEASVASVASFIYQRSNMNMSEETKKKLAKAEQEALNGQERRLSIEALADTATDLATERLATLTDEEIELAANTYNATPEGLISLRSSGKLGFIYRDEFIRQIKVARVQSQNKDVTLTEEVRPFVAEEIKERVALLSEALPEQFGNAETSGVTPLQAVLVTYSIAADDLLADSQGELASQVATYKSHRTYVGGENVKRPHDYDKAYGVNGVMYSSPINLVFNSAAMNALVARFEKGGVQ